MVDDMAATMPRISCRRATCAKSAVEINAYIATRTAVPHPHAAMPQWHVTGAVPRMAVPHATMQKWHVAIHDFKAAEPPRGSAANKENKTSLVFK